MKQKCVTKFAVLHFVGPKATPNRENNPVVFLYNLFVVVYPKHATPSIDLHSIKKCTSDEDKEQPRNQTNPFKCPPSNGQAMLLIGFSH